MTGLRNRKRGLDLTNCQSEKFADRFWSKVDSSGDCWLWTAYVQKAGYGQFTVKKGVFFGAHCVAYALVRGPIAPGLSVCHHCDNPPCVNPDHLFLGTQSDNAFDMLAKGRATRARGVDHPCARLTESKIRAIRSTAPYWGRVKDLAEEHGVSTHAIRRVLSHATWAHVDEEAGSAEVGQVPPQ